MITVVPLTIEISLSHSKDMDEHTVQERAIQMLHEPLRDRLVKRSTANGVQITRVEVSGPSKRRKSRTTLDRQHIQPV